MKVFPLILILSVLFLTCLELDPFLFNNTEVSQYKLDDYEEETECSGAIDFLERENYEEPNVEIKTFLSGSETIYSAFCYSDSTELTENDTILLYFHGTSNHIDFYWPRIRLLYATDYPVLTIDYRGYGMSTGTPDEEGIFEDGRNACDFIADSLGNPNIIIYAYSLGSLVGCELSSSYNKNDKIIGLVLEAPIGSVETLVQDASYLNLPGSFVTSFTSNNAEKIKKVTHPLLWLHGTNDQTLPIKTNGIPLWENYGGESGTAIKVKNAGHSTIPQTLGYSPYITILKTFIHQS